MSDDRKPVNRTIHRYALIILVLGVIIGAWQAISSGSILAGVIFAFAAACAAWAVNKAQTMRK
ncbi:hypothetical protein [Corynebacterium sp. 335C]